MTDEEQAFLDSIISNRDDDAPRLIYADWLDEQGHAAHAEFIRVQIELAKYKIQACPNRRRDPRLPDTLYGFPVVVDSSECGKCRYCSLKKREEELYGSWEVHNRLFSVNDPCSTLGTLTRSPQRGFVEDIWRTYEDWISNADHLTRRLPLRTVHLTTPVEYNVLAPIDKPWTGKITLLARLNGRDLPLTRIGPEMSHYSDDIATALLRDHWPTIEFTFPEAISTGLLFTPPREQ